MNYFINESDGPARIGTLLIDKNKIIAPEIFYLKTNRFKAPDFAKGVLNKASNTFSLNIKEKNNQVEDYLFYYININKSKDIFQIKNNTINPYNIIDKDFNLQNIDLRKNEVDVFIVSYANQLFNKSKKFIDFIIRLRKKIGPEKTIYTPAIATPYNLAFLSYIGVDLFDSIQSIIFARNNVMMFTDGEYDINDLKETQCDCPACFNKNEMKFENIKSHNFYQMDKEIKRIRNHIKNNDLRNLVEKRVKTNPALTGMLRYLDYRYYEYLEKYTTVVEKSKIFANSFESLNRPEIKRFQQRIISRYKKPDSAKVLLLLPCSAKKPYSTSKSHKLFRKRIYGSENSSIIHEIIITSPMGIVPRELEIVYPAPSYDIPVIGDWYEDEKKIILDLLTRYLENNHYDSIIIHLPPNMVEFLKNIFKKPVVSCIDNPTSKLSLEKLSDILKNILVSYDKVNIQKRNLENMKGLCTYQFGEEIAEKIVENATIKGRFPNLKIMKDKKQIGMQTIERGFISLTLEGAKILADISQYWVSISDDFELKGSIFAPGVLDADTRIRPGDEVVILRGNRLCGVGVAQINGEDMKTLTYGEAVKTRHHI